QPIPYRAVPNLVVVLGERHESLPGQAGRGPAEAMVARLGVPTRVDERVAVRGGEVLHPSVVRGILFALAGEQRVQRVMEVVVPLRIAVDAAAVLRCDEPR